MNDNQQNSVPVPPQRHSHRNFNQQQGLNTPTLPHSSSFNHHHQQQQQQQQQQQHSTTQIKSNQMSPSSSFTSPIDNAAKLAYKSAQMGSMQSLNVISNTTSSITPSMNPTQALISSIATGKLNYSQNEEQYNHEVPFVTFSGEKVIEEFDVNSEILYIQPGDKAIRGYLIVTNFRFYFQNFDIQNGSIILDIPLGVINRIEKIGHQSSRQQNSYGILIYCKDGRRLRFANAQETRSRKQIFDTLQRYAFPISNNMDFFAKYFKPTNYDNSGWNIYDAESEYKRMGVFNHGWRSTDINKNYSLCETYPKYLIVPKEVDDELLKEVADYRSKGRLPVMSWIASEKDNQAVICRSSQPCSGILDKRSKSDESYLKTLIKININSVATKLAILDARPKVNAIANRTKGGGYENEDYYENCEVTFLNIQNIHVMRESLRKVYDMVYTSEDKNFYQNLENSKWLEHIKCVLIGANKVVNKIHHARTSVLVHCSDGWDRTAQLTSLSMIMLDKYYRTIKGFEILIEKEWLSFGHRFALRMGHGVDKHSDQDHSPIFVQFIDCVWQIQQQNKKSFEFNEEFLLTILKNIYTCQFGTFLYNSEKEREKNDVKNKTISLWSYINSNENEFKNSSYVEFDGVITCSASPRILRLWTNYYFKNKQSVNDNLFENITMNQPFGTRKNLFTQVMDQMKKSKQSLSEPILVKYNRNQGERNIISEH